MIDIQIRETTGCSVVAFKRDEKLIINPDPAIVLEKNDELVLIGTAGSEKMFIEKYPAASEWNVWAENRGGDLVGRIPVQ